MISVCFLFFKIPLPRGGSYPSIVIPTGAKHRIQSPLERWPRTVSTDRPEMESRPYECLLQSGLPFPPPHGPFIQWTTCKNGEGESPHSTLRIWWWWFSR